MRLPCAPVLGLKLIWRWNSPANGCTAGIQASCIWWESVESGGVTVRWERRMSDLWISKDWGLGAFGGDDFEEGDVEGCGLGEVRRKADNEIVEGLDTSLPTVLFTIQNERVGLTNELYTTIEDSRFHRQSHQSGSHSCHTRVHSTARTIQLALSSVESHDYSNDSCSSCDFERIGSGVLF